MTIPIIPGPFSFLESAGNAVGQLGNAIIQRNQLRRQIAEHGTAFITDLVQKGYLSADAFKDPDVQATMKRAGIPAIAPANILPQPDEKKKRLAAADLDTVTPGTPQSRAISGIPSADVAAVGEEAQVATGNQAIAAAGTDISKSKLFQSVYDGAKTLLGNDAFAARLAQEAALGILPHRLQQIELQRYMLGLGKQAQSDAAKLLVEAISQTGAQYKDIHDKWQQGLDQALLLAGAPTDPKVRQKIIDTYTKDHGTEPQYDEIAKNILQTQYGLTPEQFQQGVKTTLRPVLGNMTGDETAVPDFGQGQTGDIARIFYGVAHDPAALQNAITQFQKHLKDGEVSTLTAQAVVSRLKNAGVFDDATLKAIMTVPSDTTGAKP